MPRVLREGHLRSACTQTAGKTPMAELVARRCWDLHGVVPLVLSRGYQGGDEARMVQRRLMEAGAPGLVGVGPDRAQVAQKVTTRQYVLLIIEMPLVPYARPALVAVDVDETSIHGCAQCRPRPPADAARSPGDRGGGA